MKHSTSSKSDSDLAGADHFHTRPASQTDVEAAVAAIMDSGVLGNSDRRSKLLHYLVEQELAGHGDDIKAFTIAVDVLGRDESFDPSTDSIVRSEVGRLREALRLFYAEKAGPDLTLIEIPKGTYRPKISNPDAELDSGQRPRSKTVRLVVLSGILLVGLVSYLAYVSVREAEPRVEAVSGQTQSETPYDVVRIAVAPFDAKGTNPNANRLAFGIYLELSMDLSAYPWISVVSPVGGFEDILSIDADYILHGEIYWDEDDLQGATRLVSLPEQKVIWSEIDTVKADVKTIEAEIVEVSSKIATELGALSGIAPELVKAQNARSSDEGLEAFLCYLDLYHYLEFPSDERHLHIRRCLTDAVEEHPTFGDGWAALAMIYMDEARFGRNPRPASDPWVDAERAVEQALKYEPLRMPVLNAALIESVESPDQDLEAFELYAERLTELFPRHTATMVNVGSRRAEFAGQWEKGEDLVNRAIDLHPSPPSSYFVTGAYRAALGTDDANALRSVQRLIVETSRSQLLLQYLAAARNGLPGDMSRYRTLLKAQGLETVDDISKHVQRRGYTAELESTLLEQLDRAAALDAIE